MLGVEEEFHVVDLHTRRSAPEVDALLEQLDGDEFAPELQRSLVETNTPVCATLDELRHHLKRLRGALEAVAAPLGLGVVAAGTVPLVDQSGDAISAGARYERMQHEYQLLVSEQHICGAQVHVDVPNRDVAVQVVPPGRAVPADAAGHLGQLAVLARPRLRLRQLPVDGLVALAHRGPAG